MRLNFFIMATIYIRESGLKRLFIWAFKKSYMRKSTRLLAFKMVLKILCRSFSIYLVVKHIAKDAIKDFGVG